MHVFGELSLDPDSELRNQLTRGPLLQWTICVGAPGPDHICLAREPHHCWILYAASSISPPEQSIEAAVRARARGADLNLIRQVLFDAPQVLRFDRRCLSLLRCSPQVASCRRLIIGTKDSCSRASGAKAGI